MKTPKYDFLLFIAETVGQITAVLQRCMCLTPFIWIMNIIMNKKCQKYQKKKKKTPQKYNSNIPLDRG